jgi:hypothetical protein
MPSLRDWKNLTQTQSNEHPNASSKFKVTNEEKIQLYKN